MPTNCFTNGIYPIVFLEAIVFFDLMFLFGFYQQVELICVIDKI